MIVIDRCAHRRSDETAEYVMGSGFRHVSHRPTEDRMICIYTVTVVAVTNLGKNYIIAIVISPTYGSWLDSVIFIFTTRILIRVVGPISLLNRLYSFISDEFPDLGVADTETLP